VTAAIKLYRKQEVGLGTRSKTHRVPPERIQIDRTHIGRRSGDFKLLARPFPWFDVSTFTKSFNYHTVAGDVWRIGLSNLSTTVQFFVKEIFESELYWPASPDLKRHAGLSPPHPGSCR
jgi:hypothetical protein